MPTEFQKTLKAGSIKNRRRGHRAYETRKRNSSEFVKAATSISLYSEFEKDFYGGRVERTILRIPFDKNLPRCEIEFAVAGYECSGFAEVIAEKGEFKTFSGKQIQYLLTVDEMFLFPSFNGALAELFDTGAEIKTRKARYRLVKRVVSNN